MITSVYIKNSFTFSFDKIRLFIDSVQKNIIVEKSTAFLSLFDESKCNPHISTFNQDIVLVRQWCFWDEKDLNPFAFFLKVHHYFPYFFDQGVFFVSVENEIEIAKSLQQDLTMGKEKICISFRRFCKYMRTMAHFDS